MGSIGEGLTQTQQQQQKHRKTPQEFLGDNAALVNLDQLVSNQNTQGTRSGAPVCNFIYRSYSIKSHPSLITHTPPVWVHIYMFILGLFSIMKKYSLCTMKCFYILTADSMSDCISICRWCRYPRNLSSLTHFVTQYICWIRPDVRIHRFYFI